MLKTICLNNLFGLDLMGEAAEIAKLRLFLKLAAQLDDVAEIEPLPDLEFNIKRGNLLVGIADRDDARRRFEQSMLAIEGLSVIEDAAKQAARAHDRFAAAQLADVTGVGVAGKQRLRAHIRDAVAQADVALFEMRGEPGEFDDWKNSHVPFHWFAEFSSVWRTSGFDVIVGNPPYVKPKNVHGYVWIGYATQECPDLYAVCMERASTLLNDRGRMAMIVLHSLCFNRQYQPLRAALQSLHRTLWVSSYARIPDELFSGSARVFSSIAMASRDPEPTPRLYVSRCRRWLSEFRPTMFRSLTYTKPPVLLTQQSGGLWPFLDEPDVGTAFEILLSRGKTVSNSFLKGRTRATVRLGYRTVAYSMLSVWLDEPPARNPAGMPDSPSGNKWLYFTSSSARDLAYLIFAGRWGFVWWLIYGDAFHVTKRLLASFPADLLALAGQPDAPNLQSLASQLSEQSADHVTWKKNRGWMVGNYDLRKCRDITDEADLLLARAWGIEYAYEAAGNLRDRMTFGQRA